VCYTARTMAQDVVSNSSRQVIYVKPVFHFARIVPKHTGEHAQIEKR
jgi:hypothetical protein